MSQLTGVTWNAHQGRADVLRELVQLLAARADHPHIITLHEVWDWHGTIPGYRRLAADRRRFPHREADSTVHLLRRKGTRLVGRGAIQPGEATWLGPHGRVHEPRVYPWAGVAVERTVWDVLGVHRSWVGTGAKHDRNAPAWRQDHRGLASWVERRAGRTSRPTVMPGDWNPGGMKDTEWSVAELARQLGGVLKLRGPDGVLGIGCRLGVEQLDGKLGSDHHPVRWVAQAPH